MGERGEHLLLRPVGQQHVGWHVIGVLDRRDASVRREDPERESPATGRDRCEQLLDLAPERIQDDPHVRVVLFKEALTSGVWAMHGEWASGRWNAQAQGSG